MVSYKITETATGGVVLKKVFLKIEGHRPATLLKKRLWHRCFPVNFAKLLRTPFLQNTSGRLLLLVRAYGHYFLKTYFYSKTTEFSSLLCCVAKEKPTKETEKTTFAQTSFALELYWNCISAWVFSCKFSGKYSEHLFLRTPQDGCFWKELEILKFKNYKKLWGL